MNHSSCVLALVVAMAAGCGSSTPAPAQPASPAAATPESAAGKGAAPPADEREIALDEIMASAKDGHNAEFIERCEREADAEMRACAMRASSLEELGRCEPTRRDKGDDDDDDDDVP